MRGAGRFGGVTAPFGRINTFGIERVACSSGGEWVVTSWDNFGVYQIHTHACKRNCIVTERRSGRGGGGAEGHRAQHFGSNQPHNMHAVIICDML